MDTLLKEITCEINKLRCLKMSVFDSEYKGCDISASDICLSADVLLVPLYWYIKKHNTDEAPNLNIEDYMQESVITFEAKAKVIIPSIIERTTKLDKQYRSHPFKRYRSIISRCFPQYVNSSF